MILYDKGSQLCPKPNHTALIKLSKFCRTTGKLQVSLVRVQAKLEGVTIRGGNLKAPHNQIPNQLFSY